MVSQQLFDRAMHLSVSGKTGSVWQLQDGHVQKVAGGKLEKDLQQKYDELKASAERLKKEAENKERWKEVEESLKKAGKEMENAIKAAFRKSDK